jgi:hypothetical protein
MPSTRDLINEIRRVLRQAGASYAAAGARDKHYAVWTFAMILDEASQLGPVLLFGVRPGGWVVFRGNPSDLDPGRRYTFGSVRGLRRDWEVHVDVNILGVSGATHGVDVSVIPLPAIRGALRRSGAPTLTRRGLGIEAKCLATLTPNEGRVTLGFHREVGGNFWLAANRDNDAVRTMLRMPGRRTDLFAALRPGMPSEREFRVAVRGLLSR